MSGKTRQSLCKKTLKNVQLSNLSETDKKCIRDVFNKLSHLKEEKYANDNTSRDMGCEDSKMVWKYEKFNGDLAIYAFCPKCGFHHNPSRRDSETMEASIVYQYHYCPVCGEYLYDDNLKKDGVPVTWDERDVTELWEME